MHDVELTLVETYDDVADFFTWLSKSRPVLAIDTETTGLDWVTDRLRLVQFGDASQAWAFDFDQWSGVIATIIEKYTDDIVLHNHTFDSQFFKSYGMPLPENDKRHCTMLMSHLADPSARHGLKALASVYTPGLHVAETALKTKMADNGWTWATVPITLQEYWAYGAVDCVITARLYEILKPRINEQLYEIEMTSQYALEWMARQGLLLDVEYLQNLQRETAQYITAIETWAKNEYGVNIRKTKEFTAKLLDEGWEPTLFTRTGKVSLSADALDLCDHELATAYTRLKKSEKIKSAFCDGILKFAVDGVIHPRVHPNGARTGRMTMQRPNIHQIPRSALIRNGFIARPNNSLVICDYDQAELRILAQYCEDENLINACMQDDAHSATAQFIWLSEKVTKSRRQLAKAVTYAIVYGAGPTTLAKTADVSLDYARWVLSAYHQAFPRVKQYMNHVMDNCVEVHPDIVEFYARTGRKHHIESKRKYALLNNVVQGTCADILKKSIADMWKSDIGDFLRLSMHDEVFLECPTADAEEVARETKQFMEDHTFNPPMTADPKIVTRWGAKYE